MKKVVFMIIVGLLTGSSVFAGEMKSIPFAKEDGAIVANESESQRTPAQIEKAEEIGYPIRVLKITD